MKTHTQVIEEIKPSVPCAAWHITFGGKCLNCGYDPMIHGETLQEYNARKGA